MKCRKFARTLYDYLDGTLSELEKNEFERHRSGCAACAARMESESRTGRLLRAAVEDACDGLRLDLSSAAKPDPAGWRYHLLWGLTARWRIASAVAALLIVALLVPAIVRRARQEHEDRWVEEIEVTYEVGSVEETTLVSRESGTTSIIEIRVSYLE